MWQSQTSELRKTLIDSNYGKTNEEKINAIYVTEKKIRDLDRAYLHGPHGCRLCGRRDLDLTYNPGNTTWYCESCHKFNQDYYKKHPEEGDWRELYP
ncbi:hypothetical protein LCGC14_1737380 [marine sediment metagenome]|uniref:Uncharacterized protein n=1 Tax=marine sediment metagenome TaxID=412755 RepID=A0A0F9H7M3_9ZZZZ